jgi:hypothetical protein
VRQGPTIGRVRPVEARLQPTLAVAGRAYPDAVMPRAPSRASNRLALEPCGAIRDQFRGPPTPGRPAATSLAAL